MTFTCTSSVDSLVERLAQRLGAALHVGLDEHGDDAGLGLAHLREHVLGARGLAWPASRRGTCPADTAPLRAPCARSRPPAAHRPALGAARQAQHHDRHGGRGLLHRLAVLIEHGAHAAELGAGDDRIAHLQRALLDQHGGDRAAALLDARLDDDAGGQARRAERAAPALRPAAGSRPAAGRCPAPVRAETLHEDVLAAPLLRRSPRAWTARCAPAPDPHRACRSC